MIRHRSLAAVLLVILGTCQLRADPTVLRDGRQSLAITRSSNVGSQLAASTVSDAWEWAQLGPGKSPILIGRKLVVTFDGTLSPSRATAGQPVVLVRPLTRDTWLAQAPNARLALAAAASLGQEAGVRAAYPSFRRLQARRQGWSAPPNDPYFNRQRYLSTETAATGPAVNGADLVIQSAWASTRGEGVIVAVCDDGMDARHPDLAPNVVADLSRNFFTQAAGSVHSTSRQYHGTAVAGIVAARDGNQVGIAGTSPRAELCGWILFDRSDNLLEIEALADLFQYANDRVAVQNHSWGNADFEPLIISELEVNAMSNAATLGRQGRGVVHVRSAGNTRITDYLGRGGVGEANLDGFANVPWAIAVGAVRVDGRVASYSTAGACVLVAALGGERADSTGPFSLDPVGNDGNNTIFSSGVDLADYIYPGRNEVGTSFTSPQIAGLAALLVSVRPELSARDVALILALSARPLAPDPVTQTNGAGLLTGDNVGFGVPHAGRAVELAGRMRFLTNSLIEIHCAHSNVVDIPDDGFRVLGYSGADVMQVDIGASGGNSALLDTRQGRVVLNRTWPLTDVGKAGAPIADDLSGRLALIERRPGTFEEKLNFAADAGAVAGIITDDLLSASRTLMLRSEFARIPGAFVSRTDGDALRSLASADATAGFRLSRRAARIEFSVYNPMVVHCVQVRTRVSHPRQGDLRVTLISPAGTVSLLQRPSNIEAGQVDTWTYGSRQFLLEGALGTWTLEFMDESPALVGLVSEAELILHGVTLWADVDRDGLEDDWERQHFGGLGHGGGADGEEDGLTNAAEQALGTDPNQADLLPVELAADGGNRFRLRWPALSGRSYRLEASEGLGGSFETLGVVIGRAPEGAWFLPRAEALRFFRVRLAE